MNMKQQRIGTSERPGDSNSELCNCPSLSPAVCSGNWCKEGALKQRYGVKGDQEAGVPRDRVSERRVLHRRMYIYR